MTLLRYLWQDLRNGLLRPNGQRAVTALSAVAQVVCIATLYRPWTWWVLVPVGCLALLAWAQVRVERNRRHLKAAEARLAAAKARLDPPVRPQGVVVRHADGTTTPVELAYQGRNDEGFHVWAGATPVRSGDTVEAAVLPPNCALALPVDGG